MPQEFNIDVAFAQIHGCITLSTANVEQRTNALSYLSKFAQIASEAMRQQDAEGKSEETPQPDNVTEFPQAEIANSPQS